MKRRIIHLIFLAFVCYFGLESFTTNSLFTFATPLRILVFVKTAGFKHDAIPHGVAAIQHLGRENNWLVDTTSDAGFFTEDSLKHYNAVVFFNTTGDVLDAKQQAAFERYIQAGGGYAGVHAAADTEYGWPWYNKLVGAYFLSHPRQQKAVIDVRDKNHPATSFLPDRWERFDEWYNYKSIMTEPHVLATLDEKTYEGGKNGDDHPIAWYHEVDGGRAFYTGLGHTKESYSEPLFLRHLQGGIQYAIGEGKPLNYAKAYSLPTPDENRFTVTVLDEKLDEPMELALTSSGKVYFIERKGKLKLYDPAKKATQVIGKLNVYGENEDGLLGLAVDPDFDRNHFMFLYYSPAGGKSINRLSRFTVKNDKLDLKSEKILLDIPVVRACCHSGGSLAFGPGGNLFLSLGDDTNPFESGGYNPIDERPGKWDAQKSSGNTNDRRGKILRIHPEPDGSYTIPEGNLFPNGTPGTRPEIYVMGNRNPFRISVDQRTGFLYWGEVGPDAGEDSTTRGPRGHDEVNQARKAGFFGWPYFVGNNKAYNYYDFVKGQSGSKFVTEAPVNNSPNNTGIKNLPPAQPAFIWYPYTDSKEFPLVGKGGRNAMAGPVYYADDYKNSDGKFPAYYNRKLFIYDWMRNWVMAVTMDAKGNYLHMEPFMPGTSFVKPIDLQFGKDGALYMLQYGTYWTSQNDDSKLVRIEFNEGNRKPVVKVSADKHAGAAPLTIRFSSAGSFDYDKGDELRYEWNFDKAGEVQSKETNPAFTFTRPGVYKATVKAIDKEGKNAIADVTIRVGNEPPKVTIESTGNRSFYWDNASFRYQVRVTDKEDGTLGKGISPQSVSFQAIYMPQGKDIVQATQGHQVATASTKQPEPSVTDITKGKVLMGASDCNACHALVKTSVGPSLQAIAARYKYNTSTVDRLVNKIIKGGGGVWGEREMAAHPQIPKGDASRMVSYILSLSKKPKKAAAATPLSGQFTAREHVGKGSEGYYLFTAAYKDRGSKGMATITTRATMTLHSPVVRAADCDSMNGAARGNSEDYKLVKFTSDGAYIVFKNIDLTAIAGLTYSLRPKTTSGRIELRLDLPDGKLVSATPLLSKNSPDIQQGKWSDINVTVEEVKGVHDLYFIFRGDPGTSIWNTFDVNTIYFKRK